MAKSKHKTGNRTSLKIIGGLTFIGLLIVYFFFFSSMGRTSDKEYLHKAQPLDIQAAGKADFLQGPHSHWTLSNQQFGCIADLPSLQERKPGTRITDPTICQNERRPCKECKRKAHVLKGSTSRQPQLQRDMQEIRLHTRDGYGPLYPKHL